MKSFIRERILVICMEDHGIFNNEGKFIIFKHSPICSLSVSVKEEVTKYLNKKDHLPIIIIDVIKDKKLKLKVADHYKVEHASPQILVIKDQKCIDNFDHQDITYKKLSKIKI